MSRTTIIAFRVDETELEHLDLLMRALNRNRSDLLRFIIRHTADNIRMTPATLPVMKRALNDHLVSETSLVGDADK